MKKYFIQFINKSILKNYKILLLSTKNIYDKFKVHYYIHIVNYLRIINC